MSILTISCKAVMGVIELHANYIVYVLLPLALTGMQRYSDTLQNNQKWENMSFSLFFIILRGNKYLQ